MKNFAKHLPHYFALIGILFAGVLAFTFFYYDKIFLTIIAISVAVSYVAWGVIHHLIHKDLYLATIIEYLAIAALGLVVVFSLIFRS